MPRSLGSEDTACTLVFPFILGETQNEKGEEKAEKCRKVCGVTSLAGHVPVAQEGPGASEAAPGPGALLQLPARHLLCSLPNAKPRRRLLRTHSRRAEKRPWSHTRREPPGPHPRRTFEGPDLTPRGSLHF